VLAMRLSVRVYKCCVHVVWLHCGSLLLGVVCRFCVVVPHALINALHALRCHIHASLDTTPITDAPYPRSSSGWEEIWSGMHAGTFGQASGWKVSGLRHWCVEGGGVGVQVPLWC
jgi:hypothetical protein